MQPLLARLRQDFACSTFLTSETKKNTIPVTATRRSSSSIPAKAGTEGADTCNVLLYGSFFKPASISGLVAFIETGRTRDSIRWIKAKLFDIHWTGHGYWLRGQELENNPHRLCAQNLKLEFQNSFHHVAANTRHQIEAQFQSCWPDTNLPPEESIESSE